MLSQKNYSLFSDAPLRASAVYIKVPQAIELYRPFTNVLRTRFADWYIEIDY